MDNVERYHADVRRFKYTSQQRAALIERVYNQKDESARPALIESLLWLPLTLAHRHYRGAADLDDLIQTANVAMLSALKSWSPKGGAKLTTWVRWACERDMRRENIEARSVVQYAGSADVSYDTVDEEDVLDAEMLLWENDSRVWTEVSALPPDESFVIAQIYVNGRTLREVADNMKKSHTQVARLRDSALSTLRSR